MMIVFLLLAWAPWIDGQEIHDRLLREEAHKEGTMGWVIHQDGTIEYTLICDYEVRWFPLGRWVASCEEDIL
jgi:hypothetical protein